MALENITLDFAVDNIEFEKELENEKNSRFQKAIIKAFASGKNAHTLPVEEEVLKKYADTVYDIPLVCKYCSYVDDFLSHESDETPIGFVKESTEKYNNPVKFERSPDGRLFIVIKALIWKKYSKTALNVMKNSGFKKGVSVELTASGKEYDGKIKVTSYVLQGITILGDFIDSAVKDANIELEFAQDKAEYLNIKGYAENMIKIDNNKDAAVNGKWENPRRKLFNPIVEASNSKSLLEEAYLITDFSTEKPEITKFKYPHHVIRDGKLVLHVNGLEAAFSRASAQGIVQGKVKAHLLRHYRELGLSTENFAQFNMSKEDFSSYFADELKNEESVGDNKMALEDKEKLEMSDMETETKTEEEMSDESKVEEEMATESKADEEAVAETKTEEKMADEPVDDDDKDDKDDEDDDDKVKSEEDMACEEKMSLEEAMACIQKMSSELEDLRSKNTTYMSQIEEMADYESLKKFKADTEENIRKEEEMAKIQGVMSEIESRGVCMSDEDKSALVGKFSEYNSFDAWANFAKAQVFDRVERIDGIAGIGLPFTKPQSESIWDRI